MMKQTTLFLLYAASFTGFSDAKGVLQLTTDNYSEKTAGKTVFIKFFAPWVRCECQVARPFSLLSRLPVLARKDCNKPSLIHFLTNLFHVILSYSVDIVNLWHRIGKNWQRNGKVMQLG